MDILKTIKMTKEMCSIFFTQAALYESRTVVSVCPSVRPSVFLRNEKFFSGVFLRNGQMVFSDFWYHVR